MNSAMLLKPFLVLNYFFSSIFQSLWRTGTSNSSSGNSTISVLIINVIELNSWNHGVVLAVHIFVSVKIILI